MKQAPSILHSVKRTFKGTFVPLTLSLFATISVFLLNSCKKTEQNNISNVSDKTSNTASSKLLASVRKYRKLIASAPLVHSEQKKIRARSITGQTEEYETVYLNFTVEPDVNLINLYNNVSSIQDVSFLVSNGNANVEFTENPANSNYPVSVSKTAIISNLAPMVEAAKEYLNAKGLSNQDIGNMLISEGGKEEDLVPFALVLAEIEENPKRYIDNSLLSSQYEEGAIWTYQTNSLDLSDTDTTWFILGQLRQPYEEINWPELAREVGHCTLHALGVNALFSLGSSSATVWTMSAIKTAFKKVATRFLGPIGVTIAVLDFGLCMAGVV